MLKDIYLDNGATTKIDTYIVDYMNTVNMNFYGNPSSLHNKGIETERLIKNSRESLANSLAVKSKEIIFTAGGTEANNLAIIGFLSANKRRGEHIITSSIEHPSVLEVFRYMEKLGFEVDIIDVDEKGYINLEQYKNILREDTVLISFIFANNEIGTIQNINEIVKIKNTVNPNIKIHIDAVQGYGKLDIFPNRIGIDLMSLSGHKIHGPKGIGALYIKEGLKINPIIFGGGQENNLRSGTENVPAIAALGMAVDNIFKRRNENFNYIKELNEYFINKLKESNLDFIKISPKNASPYILSIGFSDIKAEVLLHHLEVYNIFVSTGSACSSKKNKKSHVIKAIKVNQKYNEGVLRFSFSKDNKIEDIDFTIEKINEIIPKIKIRRGGRR
jgi:cysteine desulfurase